MSELTRAKRSAETLYKTNGIVVVVNVIAALLIVFLGLANFGSEQSWILIGIGISFAVTSIVVFQVIEAFSSHVSVTTEILQELQKANGYK